jgi:HAD superfamily hydrolase (TIGR01549 family)
MIHTFIFDVDGTIVDTEASIFKGLDAVLRKYAGREATPEDMRAVFGRPGMEGLQSLGFTPEEAAKLHPKWSTLSKSYADSVQIFAGMEDTLRQLKENNHLLGIVTSKTKESYALNITPFGLDDYFDVIITSSDTEEHKPSGQPLTECLRRLGITEHEAIYIGDSIYDNQCARNAAVAFGLAEWGSHTTEGFDADHIFKAPEDILSLV